MLKLQVDEAESRKAAGRQQGAVFKSEEYLHVGFTNFKTWQASTLQLLRCPEDECEHVPGAVQLQVSDLTAEDVADLLSVEHDAADVLELLGDGVRTMNEAPRLKQA